MFCVFKAQVASVNESEFVLLERDEAGASYLNVIYHCTNAHF